MGKNPEERENASFSDDSNQAGEGHSPADQPPPENPSGPPTGSEPLSPGEKRVSTLDTSSTPGAAPPDDAANFIEENPSETEPSDPGGDASSSSEGDSEGDYYYNHPHYYPEQVTEPDSGFDEEEEGGPVKTFLEHLEDLRWTLIKTLAAIMIAMIVCLIGANQLVVILSRPLDRANERMQRMAVEREGHQVVIRYGQFSERTSLKDLPPAVQEMVAELMGDRRVVTFRALPSLVGTNMVMELIPEPEAPEVLPGTTRGNLINLGPLEGFRVAFQVAIYGGIGLASPFIFYFVGQFVFPALRRNEKRYLFRALGLGAILFFLGILFCYFVVIPIVLIAAVQFSHWMGFGAEQWQAINYIGVVCRFMLGMGIGFELPIVILTLVKLDLLDYRQLVKFRMYWVVINLILSSVLTPPDPISMMLMAVPLQILYEISVLIARMWKRREEAEARAA